MATKLKQVLDKIIEKTTAAESTVSSATSSYTSTQTTVQEYKDNLTSGKPRIAHTGKLPSVSDYEGNGPYSIGMFIGMDAIKDNGNVYVIPDISTEEDIENIGNAIFYPGEQSTSTIHMKCVNKPTKDVYFNIFFEVAD